MKILNRDNKKYPIKVVLANGKSMIIPKQAEFSNSWLRFHGCSLMAEYEALQWLGVERVKIENAYYGIWPIHLLEWHKLYTKNQVKAKVTVRGVAQGINKIAKGKGKATYYRVVTANRIRKAIKAGHTVIMEQADPIHSIYIIHDNDGTFKVSYGKVSKVSIDSIAKTATKNATYRGMVVIKEV